MMDDNYDGFPERLIPAQESTPKKKVFAFGDDDEDDDEGMHEEAEHPADLDEEPASPSQIPEIAHVEATAEPAPLPAALSTPVDSLLIQSAAANLLQDPALRRLTEINEARFGTSRKTATETSRVTRGWLNSLDQRDFFLAMAYPGHHLASLLHGHATIRQLREWVNGISGCPDLLRRILTLEHLLDRRSLANRSRMPSRHQIEAALRAMPRTADVSEVLGGFEAAGRHVYEESQLVPLETSEEIANHLRILKPGVEIDAPRRQGSSLPVNPRLRGKGRPLGQRLLKPNSYCYNLVAKSKDAEGIPMISLDQALQLVNKAADLENQYGCYYSIRRRDRSSPWAMGNIEFLTTEALEAQRSGARKD